MKMIFGPDSSCNKTRDLLMQISKHLSYKQFSEYEYTVEIGDNEIRCYPNPMVFRSRYERKPETKESLLLHVLKRHIGLQVCEQISCNSCQFDSANYYFQSGVYKYKHSFNNKSRKWFNIL